MIPFIFAPMVLATIAWFATKLGLVSEVVFTAPWTLRDQLAPLWRQAAIGVLLF